LLYKIRILMVIKHRRVEWQNYPIFSSAWADDTSGYKSRLL